MRTLLTLLFPVFLIFGSTILQSCKRGESSTANTHADERLPSNLSLSPSSFRADVKIISRDSLEVLVRIEKMIQQGAAMFYSVSAGDTISMKLSSSRNITFRQDSIFEMVIEERLKINSDKPDFITRQAIRGKY